MPSSDHYKFYGLTDDIIKITFMNKKNDWPLDLCHKLPLKVGHVRVEVHKLDKAWNFFFTMIQKIDWKSDSKMILKRLKNDAKNTKIELRNAKRKKQEVKN